MKRPTSASARPPVAAPSLRSGTATGGGQGLTLGLTNSPTAKTLGDSRSPFMPNYTMQQYSGLSCGAACLLVAAKELGVTQMPIDPPFMMGQPLELSNACERAIYAVTAGGLETYSMPDGIALAAGKLGLDVSVHMSGCLVPKLLEWRYPHVRTALSNMNVDIESGTPVLQDHQRMLVAVGVGLLGLHWVLYRPDTTYMDPAYNKNYACSLWGMGQLGVLRYVDTGVYVVVSSRAVV